VTNMTAFKLAMLIIVEALGIAHCTGAHAAEYPTAQEAAIAALAQCASVPYAHTHECAGVIIQTGASFAYSEPVQGNEDNFRLVARFPVGSKLVAIYHTHPGVDAHLASSFSPQDRQVSKTMHLPSYLRVIASEEVFVLKTSGLVDQISSHSLCHGMECADYYKRQQHLILAAMGLEQR